MKVTRVPVGGSTSKKHKKYMKRMEKLARKDHPNGCGMDGLPTKKNSVQIAHEMRLRRHYAG